MGIAIFINAHEDDETLSMGAAIVNHYNAGHQVHTLVCTDGGDSSVWPEYLYYDPQNPVTTRDDFCLARLVEYLNAASSLGVSTVQGIDTTCPVTGDAGFNGMIKDSYLNLAALYNNVSYCNGNVILRSCYGNGYMGNDLGPNYSKVNIDLYNAIKSSLQSIANVAGISTTQLLVKTHSHMDVPEDHRAVCQAVLRLYNEGFITDLRHYVSPLQWDNSFTNNGYSFPSAATLNAFQESPSSNQNRIDTAISHYVKSGVYTTTGIYGTDTYGIGYLSVATYFDILSERKYSYCHVPPTIYTN